MSALLQLYTYIAFPSETVTRSGYQARPLVLLEGWQTAQCPLALAKVLAMGGLACQ